MIVGIVDNRKNVNRCDDECLDEASVNDHIPTVTNKDEKLLVVAGSVGQGCRESFKVIFHS